MVNDRLKSIRQALKMSQSDFANSIGLEQGSYSGIESGKKGSITRQSAMLLEMIHSVNMDWLMTGKGEMFKNSSITIDSNRGNNNKIECKNGGNVGVGNTVNVSLPESGTQKIIKPNGAVELTSSDSSSLELESMKKDIESLMLQISHLKDNMATKDELIASLKETIELLKHRQ